MDPVRPARLVLAARARLTSVRSVASRVHDPLAVADRHVSHSRLLEHRGDRDPCGSGTGDHDAEVGQLLADHLRRVGQGRRHHDRCPVLVVVEDRDVEAFLQLPFDGEAPRSADVLEVDATEGRGEAYDRLDDVLDLVAVEADRHSIDPAELLEEQRLALHDRERAEGTEVAEAQDRRTVGDHRDDVGPPGVEVGQARVLGDRRADPTDARGVGDRQGGIVVHLDGRPHLDLAAPVHLEDRVAGQVVRDRGLSRGRGHPLTLRTGRGRSA